MSFFSTSTFLLLSFSQFLDSCTMLLQLPSAARRLFDENGEEHFTLQSFKRDQTVFVSCGEGWSDPKLTREEQQRRILLSQLSSDVGKIRQYCSQRNPQGELLLFVSIQGHFLSYRFHFTCSIKRIQKKKNWYNYFYHRATKSYWSGMTWTCQRSQVLYWSHHCWLLNSGSLPSFVQHVKTHMGILWGKKIDR